MFMESNNNFKEQKPKDHIVIIKIIPGGYTL